MSSNRFQTVSCKTVAILKCDVLLSQTQNLDLNFKASITSFLCSFLPTVASNHTFMNYNGAALHNHKLHTCKPWYTRIARMLVHIDSEWGQNDTLHVFSPLRAMIIWAYQPDFMVLFSRTLLICCIDSLFC